ncbi:MAG: hypothetical protein U1E30_11470 [Rhodoblastus sp.]
MTLPSWRRAWSAIWWLIGRSDPSALDAHTLPFSWRAPAFVLLVTCADLNLVAYAQGLGREGEASSVFIFWLSVFLLVGPGAYLATRPNRDWKERLAILVIIGQSLHLIRFFHTPTRFGFFDEFLHWRTALDILELHSLFAFNSILPISPLYPGLELPTVALCELAGISIFASSIIIIAIARFVSVCLLFLIFRETARSGRIAAIATIVFMGNSSFGNFHAQYAYETLAFVFFLYILRLVLTLEEADAGVRWDNAKLAILATPALAVTHHLTSYLTAAIAASVALLYFLRPVRGQPRRQAGLVMAFAFAAPLVWAWLIKPPTGPYLTPLILEGLADLGRLLSGASGGRKLFVASDGTSVPLLLQLLGMSSVLFVAVGLFFGFFRTLTFDPAAKDAGRDASLWPWRSSSAVALGLLAACYPLTVAFRLTVAGWEIGNRLSSFVSVGAAFVVAISITHFFQARWRGRRSMTILSVVLGAMVVGGMINGWGVAALRTTYKVGADGQSVEPVGLAVAEWSRRTLGQGNRFVADRVNGILLSTIGRQLPLSTLFGDPGFAGLFYDEKFSYAERNIVRSGDVDYVLVDLRLSQALPRVGHYYEPGDIEAHGDVPPRLQDLLKFDRAADVDRIMDAGQIVIYDVRGVRSVRLPVIDPPAWVACRICWLHRSRAPGEGETP